MDIVDNAWLATEFLLAVFFSVGLTAGCIGIALWLDGLVRSWRDS